MNLPRRGRCKICGGRLTVLPAWCVPGAHYSLLARQQALHQLGQGDLPNRRAALPGPGSPRRFLHHKAMVLAAHRKSALLRLGTHPVCLGLARRRPYSDRGANLTMMDPYRDTLQPRISLLDYLQQRGWKIVRDRGPSRGPLSAAESHRRRQASPTPAPAIGPRPLTISKTSLQIESRKIGPDWPHKRIDFDGLAGPSPGRTKKRCARRRFLCMGMAGVVQMELQNCLYFRE